MSPRDDAPDRPAQLAPPPGALHIARERVRLGGRYVLRGARSALATLGAFALAVALVGVASARGEPQLPPSPTGAQREHDSTACLIARAWLQPTCILLAVVIVVLLAGLRELRRVRKRLDDIAVDLADVNLGRRVIRLPPGLS